MPPVRSASLSRTWLAGLVLLTAVAAIVALAYGPVDVPPGRVGLAVIDALPGVSVNTGLSPLHESVIEDIRLPRVVLGLMVGAMLSISGAAYQGAFRNPLADPFLLGIAAGAGLGATLAIISNWGGGGGYFDPVPLAAFAGGLLAMVVSLAIGNATGRSTVTLILSGVAVASFFTAAQTYLLQRNIDVVQEVYTWLLGRISTSGWTDVQLLLPYMVVCTAVLLRYSRALDVLAVGDEEARSLGVNPTRVRLIVVITASLATAATVSVAGLIGFVGIVVPHAVRQLMGASNRVVLPMAAIAGAGFMVVTDFMARTLIEPAELPVGAVTAFIGAPFFALILRSTRRNLW